MSDDKVKAWIEAARRDGDEEAARAIEELLARAEKSESRARDLQAKLADYMRADKALTEAAEKWKARAEQAERERDKRALEMCAVQDAEMKARCRAEADNAALLDAARKTVAHLREKANPKECQCGAEEGTNVEEHDETCPLKFLEPRLGGTLMGGDHPGAALLERLRAIEAALPLAVHDEACGLIESKNPGKMDPERCALCAAFDALKEKP